MNELMVRLQNTFAQRDERGAAMAEYGLLLALVALVAMAILSTFGDTLADTFGFASETFNNAPGLGGEEATPAPAP